jgi:hypothetical protein
MKLKGSNSDMSTHRIRVDFVNRAFEVEGPAEFVESHAARLQDALAPTVPGASNPRTVAAKAVMEGKGPFGEVLHQLTSTSGTDRLLLAAWYVESASSAKLFTTGEANKLLKEQGIKLSNPSQTAANLQKAKLIFRDKGKLKIAKPGLDRLEAIGGL